MDEGGEAEAEAEVRANSMALELTCSAPTAILQVGARGRGYRLRRQQSGTWVGSRFERMTAEGAAGQGNCRRLGSVARFECSWVERSFRANDPHHL
jgi:hypothetical protein